MTNEEIVAMIQAGNLNMIGLLWENMEKLICWKAQRVVAVLPPGAGVEIDDLINTGFLALAAAVETFELGEGRRFHTWLMFYLKKFFAYATGYSFGRDKHDPLRYAVSLSAPIVSADDEGELIEIIADPTGEAEIDKVEESMWRMQLQETVSIALEELPVNQREVIHNRFIKGQSPEETAARLGINQNQVHHLERMAIRELRRPRNMKRLAPYFYFDYFTHTGHAVFLHSGSSVQEQYLMKKEEYGFS